MGTDIHPAVEVFRDGAWRYHRPKTECPYYYEYHWDRATGKVYDLDANGNRIRSKWDRCKTRLPEFFVNRNYAVFGVLAGIRWDPPTGPIQDGRGIPFDITPEARAKLSDEHSPGWVSLSELKAYDYKQIIPVDGTITEDEFLRMVRTGDRPKDWSGSVMGQKVVTLEPREYAALYKSAVDLFEGKDGVKTSAYDDTKSYYIRHVWKQDLMDFASSLPNEWIPYLEKLVPKGGTDEDVRVVFDFDS